MKNIANFLAKSFNKIFCLGKDKKRLNAALPAGVTEKDVSLFTRSQEKAQSFLSHENKVRLAFIVLYLTICLTLLILQGMDDDSCPSSTPKALTSTPLSKNAPVQVNYS